MSSLALPRDFHFVSTACFTYNNEANRISLNYVRRTQESGRSITRSGPSIVRNKLSSDEWAVIERYHEILKPLKDATKLLQSSAGGKFGAIRQVLPTFEKLLSHFESLRVRYPIAETISSVDHSLLTSQHHFTTSINLGWQKLNEYYNKLDETPVYVAAVVLHPRMKWRYLEKRWTNEDWLVRAKKTFSSLWIEYATLDRPLRRHKTSRRTSPSPKAEGLVAMMLSYDESSDDDGCCDVVKLAQYLAKPRHSTLSLGDSPIAYWIGNSGRWPELASMALDIFAVPAMSDAPERMFSTAGDVLSPRRRLLHSETLGWLMSLKTWINSEVIVLDDSLFDRLSSIASAACDNVPDTAFSEQLMAQTV